MLKLLQKSYLGKVKMIYIDPPYNTGNDFIYPDNYTESLQTYLEYTGQVDDEGHRFGTNTDTDGRFHSKWLNMMYPRLYLARNLLREDGVIFVSIDDHEVDNLRMLCDEVFGEENFVATVIWQKRCRRRTMPSPPRRTTSTSLVYARAPRLCATCTGLRDRTEAARDYKNPTSYPRRSVLLSDLRSARQLRTERVSRHPTPLGRGVGPPARKLLVMSAARRLQRSIRR